ncbi:MAG: PAS domain S-box protein [Desulfatibacillum sp.]|nr:PAS domain S-box protein [Desulfatibacillum sp.]
MQRSDEEIRALLAGVDAFSRKLVVVSPDYVILGANQFVQDRFKDSVVGKRCYELLHQSDTPCTLCPATQVFSSGSAASVLGDEFVGLDINSCLRALPIQPEGEIKAALVLDLDVPALGGLEAQLQRSNSFLRNLINSSVDGVIAADKTGRIIVFNQAASDISGYDRQHALYELDIRDVYPGEGAKNIMAKLRSEEYGGKGKLKSYPVDVVNKNGDFVPIRLNASIIYENGHEVATIGFFHDMRQALEIRQELHKTQVQLLQAEKMSSLGKLAAGVAHQLNNPLGGIILFSQLILEEYELPEGAIQDLKRILEDAQRSRDIVKELLEFARQTRQEVRPHDLNRAISRTLFLLENQSVFQNIVTKRNLAEDLPPVPADIQQLNHVFMNIILNAAEAMEGRGELRITTFKVPGRDKVAIEISDTGPGIPEEVLPHVFEPFYTTKEQGKGTGLGLSLVYGIVESHRGRIMASNNHEGGAVFRIELPLEQDSDQSDTDEG